MRYPITNKLVAQVVNGELSIEEAAKVAAPQLDLFSPGAAGMDKAHTEAFFKILAEWRKNPTKEAPPTRSNLRSSGEQADGSYKITEGGYDDDLEEKGGQWRHR